MWTKKQEEAANKLIAKINAMPHAAERHEFGMMLMRNINSFSPEEMRRYEELKEILKNDNF